MVTAAFFLTISLFQVDAGLHWQLLKPGQATCEHDFTIVGNSPRHDLKQLMVHVPLQVELSNYAETPQLIGKVQVARQWFYRKDSKGRLRLIRASDAPEEFLSKNKTGYIAIENRTLWPNETKRISLDYHVAVDARDIQQVKTGHELVVGLLITNMKHNGEVSNYWSGLITIDVPQRCISGKPE